MMRWLAGKFLELVLHSAIAVCLLYYAVPWLYRRVQAVIFELGF